MVLKPTIANLFARSPFKPLQEHIELVSRCAAEVVPLFETLIAGNDAEHQAVIDKIFALESEADKIKHDLREHLPKTLFMPVDRGDILKILDLQDQIADTAQDIAGLLQVRKFDVIPSFSEPLLALVQRCIDACVLCEKIINELDELIVVGFKGRESEIVGSMITELNKIESDTDQMGTDLTRLLFTMEGQISDVSLILWSRLIRDIGGMADYAEMVGNRLRLLIAR
ncbi:TIGR00153 family protein [Kordiimonas aquimaris]|uniref:TIGR00153 family protein n=1 Tax=Kordiimonas aquimaris TaxID=707591 RepID=UPI0021D2F147|nr:TIGR00153 family protein [Kordiimonas aquimaris]